MTIVGRSQLDHPALGSAGGSALHASIQTLYTNIGDDIGARFDAFSSIANSAVTVIEHNFGIPFADLKINLYTGTHPALVRVADPVASGWTIAATVSFLKTKISVTAPASGGPHTFAVFTMQSRGSEKLADLDDINFSTVPIDGQFLIYDTATSKWLPAYLKYKSETATIVSNTVAPSTGTNIQRIIAGAADLQMISSPVAGKVYVLVNETGSSFLIKNDTGSTAANRFYTGTGADITLKNQAAITAIYNSGLSRWVLAGGSGGGGGLTTQIVSAGFTAVDANHYLVDNSSTAFTATLPAGGTGKVIRFSDTARNWSAKNLTITPATGEAIDGLAVNTSLICDKSGAFVQLMWTGTKWAVDTNDFTASISNGALSGREPLGKKNYIGNPNNATNWIVGGATVTVTTESTSANLPDQITQTTAIAITRVSGTTGYAAYRFEMDRSDYGKKFEIGFDQKSAFTTEGYQVQAFAGSVFGTYGTQLTVSTAALSALIGSFISTIDMPGSATPFIEFRIVATGSSGTAPFYANNVYFGPGVTTQGAAISDWVTFAPTISNGGTLSINTGYWRRNGSNMDIISYQKFTTAGAAGALRLSMPTGYTINTTILPADTTSIAGHGEYANTTSFVVCDIYPISTTQFNIITSGGTNDIQGNGLANNHQIGWKITVPVNEFSGSGTVNFLNSNLLSMNARTRYYRSAAYSYTSNATFVWDAVDSTTFQTNGNWVNTSGEITIPANGTYEINTAIQASALLSDASQLEIWVSRSGGAFAQERIIAREAGAGYKTEGSSYIYLLSGDKFRIQFGSNATVVNSQSNTYLEVVRLADVSASSPVGFGLAGTDGSSGLVKLPLSMIRVDTGNGHGATNTKIRRFTNSTTTGTAITYTDSAANGATFTVNEAGVYAIAYTDRHSSAAYFGISLNSASLTTSIASISTAERLVSATAPSDAANCSATVKLAAGDVIRPHTDGSLTSVTAMVQLVITQVSKY
jgi:hypothetical protein